MFFPVVVLEKLFGFKIVVLIIVLLLRNAIKSGRINPSFPTAALSASGIKGLSHQISDNSENGPLADAVKLMEM